MSWFVYILQSEKHGKLYTGITNDPDRRLREHNTSPRGAKSTRSGRPWKRVFLEPQPDQVSAMRRERRIKGFSRAAKLRLIETHHQVELSPLGG